MTTSDSQEARFLEHYTFDNFVVGVNNFDAYDAATKVADAPAQIYNPLYIHGGVGIGKTHLLHAIANQILANYPNMKIQFISSEIFMTMFLDSMNKSTICQFHEQFRLVDILMVDNIQFFAGKIGIQVEFFHTFNALYGAGKQIILTSDFLPSKIEFLEERLRSRFEQGLVVDIYSPNLETRVDILKKKALREGVDLKNDVAFILADSIHANVRELEGGLIRLLALASMRKKPITPTLAIRSLHNITRGTKPRQVSIYDIQRIVSAYYKIRPKDLCTKKRSHSFRRPRRHAIYLCRQLTDYSYKRIGMSFRNLDKKTVKRIVSRMTKKIKTKNSLSFEIQTLTEILTSQ